MELNRAFKSVAVIVLLALISPVLFGASHCIARSLDASRCTPGCPMMDMKTGIADRASATPAQGTCCKVSGRLPESNQAAIAQQVSMVGTVQPAVSAPHPTLPPDRLIRLHETAPPVSTSSQQALLCTFLV
jgi:hypothetical protein